MFDSVSFKYTVVSVYGYRKTGGNRSRGGVTQAQRTWGEEEEDCFLTVGCAGKMNSGPK